MPMPSSFRDRDQAKFKETSGGETAVRVISEDVSLPPGASTLTEQQAQTTGLQTISQLLENNNFNWDNLVVTYPLSTQEVYTYTLGPTIVKVYTVNYTNANKQFISSVTVS